jgi:hypothetical protein
VFGPAWFVVFLGTCFVKQFVATLLPFVVTNAQGTNCCFEFSGTTARPSESIWMVRRSTHRKMAVIAQIFMLKVCPCTSIWRLKIFRPHSDRMFVSWVQALRASCWPGV